ncbi:MAG: J domain-containing protein [Acidimicrobiales bacterium]
MNYFDLLRVDPDATAEQIASAYRSRARQLHPDTKPDATDGEKAHLTAAMAELNNAWSTLRDPERRAEYISHLNDPVEEPVVMRAPASDECLMCGSHPAATVSFQHQRAVFFTATVWTTDARLCRGCGLAIGRSSQNRTLWTGWFGIFAFFRNLRIVFTNSVGLYRVGRLSRPRRRPDLVFAPFERALDPRSPAWQRSGAAFVTIVVVALGLWSALSEPPATQPSTSPPTVASGDDRPLPMEASWQVGSCVSGNYLVTPVPCSAPNDGEIIARASSSWECPSRATSYVEAGPTVWCIR